MNQRMILLVSDLLVARKLLQASSGQDGTTTIRFRKSRFRACRSLDPMSLRTQYLARDSASAGRRTAAKYKAIVTPRPSQGRTLDIQMVAYSKLSLSRVSVILVSSAKIGSPPIKLQQHLFSLWIKSPIGQHVPLAPKTSTHFGCLMQYGSASSGTAPVSFTMHFSLSLRDRCSTTACSKMRNPERRDGHSPTFRNSAPKWTGALILYWVGIAGCGGSRNQDASTQLDPFHLCSSSTSAASQHLADSQRDCTILTQRTSYETDHCIPTQAPVQSVFSVAM
mmetsp:Transcript_108224/g.258302  ORF Transcript_108224/g.258302 Transcript_108224/m.258302 type:complete len:280 (-) Transcript_108224:778-1617(-)